MTLPRIYPHPTPRQHQFQLTSAILGVLATYGRNPKFIFTNGQPEPAGNWLKWVEQHPADGVQAEIAGTMLTVMVKPGQPYELDQADGLYFCCYDFETFRTWFATKLNSLKAYERPSPKKPSIRPSITKYSRKNKGTIPQIVPPII